MKTEVGEEEAKAAEAGTEAEAVAPAEEEAAVEDPDV